MSKHFVETNAARYMMNVGMTILQPFHNAYEVLSFISNNPAQYVWNKYKYNGTRLANEVHTTKNLTKWLMEVAFFIMDTEDYLASHPQFFDDKAFLDTLIDLLNTNRTSPTTKFEQEIHNASRCDNSSNSQCCRVNCPVCEATPSN